MYVSGDSVCIWIVHAVATDVLCAFVWDMKFLYENHQLLNVSSYNLIVLTHRVKEILDHFSSLSV